LHNQYKSEIIRAPINNNKVEENDPELEAAIKASLEIMA